MAYRPAPEMQTTPIDCVAFTAQKIVDRQTVGAKRPNALAIRKATGDTSGGITYGQVATAVKIVCNETLVPLAGVSRNELADLSAAGSGLGVIISAAITRYTTRRTGYFTGLHSVYVQSYSWWPKGEICDCEKRTAEAHGEFSVEDPGTAAGYLQWSADLLYRAADAVAGGIHVLAGKDTEGVTRTAVGGPLYDKPFRSSKVVGSLAAGQKPTVTSTFMGGGWPRADGTTAYGWHRLPGDVYATGRSLR